MEQIKKGWEDTVKKKMLVPYDVPVIFIDSVIEDGYADDFEINTFEEETSKLLNFTENGEPYVCSDVTCKDYTYSSGVPVSMDMQMGDTKYAKEHFSLELKWQIRTDLEGCGHTANSKNYEIIKIKMLNIVARGRGPTRDSPESLKDSMSNSC